mmetsp:Transcript_16593/g.38513  ORF Transcript_16593/g.38513 Transcript_16593/m.38513 type:complete len:235 (-) Transcript_16593:91-795(-)
MFSFISKTSREVAATPTPSEMNIESVSFDEEDNNSVRLGYHFKGTEEQIEEEKRKNSLYEREADRRNDENASHKDNMSVTSALSNASNKSAQSNKSFVSAVATEPTLEVVHEDVEDPLRVEVRRHYKQKSKDVAAGLSRKKMKVIVGLSGLVVGAVLGVIIGVALESREATEERANVEVAAAAYLDNYDETHGQLDYSYYYDYYYDSEIPDTGVAEAATLTSEEVNVTISSEPL